MQWQIQRYIHTTIIVWINRCTRSVSEPTLKMLLSECVHFTMAPFAHYRRSRTSSFKKKWFLTLPLVVIMTCVDLLQLPGVGPNHSHRCSDFWLDTLEAFCSLPSSKVHVHLQQLPIVGCKAIGHWKRRHSKIIMCFPNEVAYKH